MVKPHESVRLELEFHVITDLLSDLTDVSYRDNSMLHKNYCKKETWDDTQKVQPVSDDNRGAPVVLGIVSISIFHPPAKKPFNKYISY